MWKAFGYSCILYAVRLSQCRYAQVLIPRFFFGLTPRHVQVQHRNVSQQFHQDACDDLELLCILNSTHVFPLKHFETGWLLYISLYCFNSWWGGLHTGLYRAVVCFLCGDGQTFTSTITGIVWKVLLCLIVARSMCQILQLKTSVAKIHIIQIVWDESRCFSWEQPHNDHSLFHQPLIRNHGRTYETLRSCPSSWQWWIQILVI